MFILAIIVIVFFYLFFGAMYADLGINYRRLGTPKDSLELNEYLGVMVIWPLFAITDILKGLGWALKNVRPGLRGAFEILIKGE